MTDPKDLRKIEKWLRENNSDVWMAEVCEDAADDIERLRAEIARLRLAADEPEAATDNPAAWLVSRNGEPCYVSLKQVDANMERNRLELVSVGTPVIELIPLYRQPALTAEEREAVERAAFVADNAGLERRLMQRPPRSANYWRD